MEKVIFPIKNERLPLYIVGLGENNIQKGIYRENGYADYQWIQSKKGCGVVEYLGKKYEINENQGFLLPKNTAHSYYPTSPIWVQDWVTFNGNNILEIYDALNIEAFLMNDSKPIISNLISKAIQEGNQVLHISILAEILYHISRDEKKDETIDKMKSYFMNYYMKNISIEDMSKHFSITPQYFCKLFKAKFQTTPFSYLNQIRINKAKELLISEPSLKLEGVAHLCGFSSVSYFCKLFFKLENTTPTQFKNKF